MRVGLVEFRPDRSVALKNNLPLDGGMEAVVFSTADLPVERVKLNSLSPVTLAAAFRKHPCDIFLIGAYMWPAFTAALLSFFSGLRYGLEVVSWFEDDIISRGKGKPFYALRRLLYGPAYRFIFSRASVIISNSRNVADMLKERFPRLESRIFAVHNGINFEPAEPAGGEAGKVSRRILTVSNANFSTKLKGMETVIAAFEKVAEKSPEFELVGAVSVADKFARARFDKILERVRKSPAAGRISLRENVKDMPRLYGSSYLLVYCTPSRGSDGLPRALLEAQAASLPVVAGNENGCPEAISHGVTGLIVDNTADGLAQGMMKLIEEPELRDKMAAEGTEWIKSEYSWEKMAGGYREILLRARGAECEVRGKKIF